MEQLQRKPVVGSELSKAGVRDILVEFTQIQPSPMAQPQQTNAIHGTHERLARRMYMHCVLLHCSQQVVLDLGQQVQLY